MQFFMHSRHRSAALLLALGAAFGAGACDSSSTSQGSQLPVGSIQDQPGNTGLKFIVDANLGGATPNLRLLRTEWGRLVDVFDYDPLTQESTRLFSDFLVGPDIQTDGLNYVLERLPATGRELLTITHPFGSPEFQSAFDALDDSMQFFLVKGLSPNELPPFTAVPRNAAVRLVFNDLLDPTTVNSASVGLQVGYPPVTLQGARLFVDPNYGDLNGSAYRSTRVIVDLTVSQDEAAALGLTVNSLGLPEALTPNQGNAVLRIPTRPVPGQISEVLSNLSGTTLAFAGNGATDATAPSLDVVRVFRSGGRTSVTQDLFDGFLPDTTQPAITSSQQVTLRNVQLLSPDSYLLDVEFQSATCAMLPRAGDLIALSNGVYLRLVLDGLPPSGNTATSLICDLVDRVFPGATVTEGAAAQYRQPWTASSDQTTRPACWVTVLPTPATLPATGLSTDSTFTVQFSEPINPSSVNSFDSLQVLYGFQVDPPAATPVIQSRVVGLVSASADLTRFTFQPRLPLRHATGQSEIYRVRVGNGADGVLDLAGNELPSTLVDGLGALPAFTLSSAQAPVESRSVTLRFASTDEDALPNDPPGAPEFRGQLIYDLLNARIRPRSVARISSVFEPQATSAVLMPGPDVADRPPLLQPNGSIIGISMNPLTRLGARTMTVWRYFDMGMNVATGWGGPVGTPAVFDDATFNLDVEGLWWSPTNAGVLIDNYPQFEMRLSHSKFLPDELFDPMNQVAVHPNSGLSDTFSNNLLDPLNDPQAIVHPRGDGYTINPIDSIQSLNGTVLAPWPLNRGLAVEDYRLFTWRDTSVLSRGQPVGIGAGEGVELGNEKLFVTGGGTVYALGNVPTIGLPLLMDIRCFPSTTSTQSNRPNGRLAMGPLADLYPQAFSLESGPWFTVYSGGAVTLGGVLEPVDPDVEIIAQGTNPPGGLNSLPHNQIVHYGQGDFVVRVNRAHSRWFQCATLAGASFRFAEPIVEPSLSEQPEGTQVLLHFRGATGLQNTAVPPQTPWFSADNIDPYGDSNPLVVADSTFTVNFLNNDATWKAQMSDIDGSFFFQTRITMISNLESATTPSVSALGFAFFR
jgi:hypothetical protein